MPHITVLLKEVIGILDPKPGEFFIDGTLGAGGHSRAILEKIGARGTLLALDIDASAVNAFEKRENIIIMKENYANLKDVLEKRRLPRADGIVLDLGFSSDQLEKSGRGFSFLRSNEPLDMRYDREGETRTAADALRELTEKELAKMFLIYGEEKNAARVAKEIILRRKYKPLRTVSDLVSAIESAVPYRGRIHQATKIFQALRIYVNRELENLSLFLRALPEILNISGRVAVISFHSLEDRLIKTALRNYAKELRAELLTKKPIVPSEEEIGRNPRARSAKLRAIKMI